MVPFERITDLVLIRGIDILQTLYGFPSKRFDGCPEATLAVDRTLKSSY